MAECPDYSGLKAAADAFAEGMRKTYESLKHFGEQLTKARDAELARHAFVADGGDVQSILAIERAYGVMHE